MDISDGRRNTINQEQPAARREEEGTFRKFAGTIRHERTSDVEKNCSTEFVPPRSAPVPFAAVDDIASRSCNRDSVTAFCSRPPCNIALEITTFTHLAPEGARLLDRFEREYR